MEILKQIIRKFALCIISLIISSFLAPLAGQGNRGVARDSVKVIEELVISTERPSAFQPLVRVIAVIKREEIEKTAVQNLQDLLKYIQGVDIRSRGSEGVQADINILGGTFDQTMVLINGINYTDPQTGHHSLNIPVTITQIERIEILQGPGAWSEGSVAYSGAINIITRTPESNSLGLSVAGGSYGYLKASANIGLASSKTKERGWQINGIAGGDYSRSDGYVNNTDFKIMNIYTGIVLSKASGHSLRIQTGYQDKAFGANSFYTIAYPEQFEKTRLLLSSAQYLYQNNRWQYSASVYHRVHIDHFELFRYEAPDWYTGDNYHMNRVAGINSKVAYRWGKAGTTVMGAEMRFEQIYSTVLGDLVENPKRVPFEDGLEYTKYKDRKIVSFYLRHILQLNRWRFTAGLMESQKRLYAGMAAAYALTPYLETNCWLSNSYRNPTFTDLYYKSPTQSGNIDLKPEEAITGQVGLRFIQARIKASLSAFYRYGYRIIDWTRESQSDQWNASNITNVASYGYELHFVISPVSEYITEAALSYAWLETRKESWGLHSLYATDYLRHKASFNVNHRIYKNISAKWDLALIKRAGTYLGPDNTEIPYDSYLLTDLKIIRTGNMISPYIEATNLFNTPYLHIGNLPQPGRWIKAGINFTL